MNVSNMRKVDSVIQVNVNSPISYGIYLWPGAHYAVEHTRDGGTVRA
jgi:hypothetical protein